MKTKRVKKHPEYYAIKAYQVLAHKDFDYMASCLNVSVRTYKDKIFGYSDFSVTESEILAYELGRSKEELFVT